MATFHIDGDRVQVFVKGAPDVLLVRCTHQTVAGVRMPFGAAGAAAVDAEYHALARRGTTGMEWLDWGIAIGAASTVLLFEEVRKLRDPNAPCVSRLVPPDLTAAPRSFVTGQVSLRDLTLALAEAPSIDTAS